MKTKDLLKTLAVAFSGGFIAVTAFTMINKKSPTIIYKDNTPAPTFTSLAANPHTQVDFTSSADKTVHAVVHIKTTSQRSNSGTSSFYEFFFGERYYNENPEPVKAFGSGVIISKDGYIVTNNHVIEGSDQITVTLNDKRTFTAEVIGRDPSTDIAVIRIITDDELQFINFGNSDDIKIGEWVLAVGNPFNFTSTVTAGIVSAKARNINILRKSQMSIESFIQTDAAVNPGNSGGALVNTQGELIGINTAIYTQTGTYQGYSFAVPSNLANKVVTDIIEFGAVQRAVMGVIIQEVNSDLAKELSLDKIEGVYITEIRENGAAEESKLQKGDIILSINDVIVNSTSELQEQVSRYRPGDKISTQVKRNNKVKAYEITLRNVNGDTGIVKPNEFSGAEFIALTLKQTKALSIANGISVTSIKEGSFLTAGIKEGFIITSLGGETVSNVSQLYGLLNRASGKRIEVEGIYPNSKYRYVYVVQF